MNIAFFITPKSNVVFETITATMRQVIERMDYHRYTAIPILDGQGRYVGTMTEGDLLRKLKNTPGLDIRETSRIPVTDIPMRVQNKPVHINCDMEDLVKTVTNQNFVPVLDDENSFIGIIKRSDILQYCFDVLMPKKDSIPPEKSLHLSGKVDGVRQHPV
ncbi:CBS domain-containing protein [Ethanoligenens sp.]|uniref:CBS domain-containing protein n=1 Tax=Ethanoligenens sp. TaxID=2099655 RepID=UPI0039EA3664